METVVVTKVDETYIQVFGSKSLIYELGEYFTFEIPNHQHMPKFKNKLWDGKIRLFNRQSRKIYKGLFSDIVKFCADRNYQLESDYKPTNSKITREQCEQLFTHFKGPFSPHNHQIESLYQSLVNQCAIIISPTASGKSYFLYILTRFLEQTGKGLIIVPNTNLVEQLYKDFEYSSKNDDTWNIDDRVAKIYSGKTKTPHQEIIISTWQSIYKMPPEFFHPFKYVIGDEVHHFKASSLKTIMENASNAEYRIGCTGSLDDTETHEKVLRGLFGPIKKVISTSELMKEGKVAQLSINAIIMEHDPNDAVLKMKHAEQTKWFCMNEKRNQFIRKIIAGEKDNKLVLFQFVEDHGIPLFEAFKKEYPDKEAYYISGQTSIEERERIRKRLSETDDATLFASYGTYSTGMNVPSIRHVFSTYPGKSIIRILQSIGRALRLKSNKTTATFWDFGDIMIKGAKNNLGMVHLEYRLKLYMKEKFKVKSFKVKI